MFVFFFCALAVSARNARCEDEDGPDSFDLLGAFPTREASSRIKPYQFRLSAYSGGLKFSSSKPASESVFIIDNGSQFGARTELEHWFRLGSKNRRSVGILADLQYMYVGTFKAFPG